MEQSIKVLDLSPELFNPFEWDAMEANPNKAAYRVITDSVQFMGFPNDIVFKRQPVFIVDRNGNGLMAYYLSAIPSGANDAKLLLGLDNPLSVVTVKKSELEVMHPIGGSFQINEIALEAFGKAGLINQIASFSVGQRWRPWQRSSQ